MVPVSNLELELPPLRFIVHYDHMNFLCASSIGMYIAVFEGGIAMTECRET